jgi:hypothetical protein
VTGEVNGNIVYCFSLEIPNDKRNQSHEFHPYNLFKKYDFEAFSILNSNGKTLSHARIVDFYVSPVYITNTKAIMAVIYLYIYNQGYLSTSETQCALYHG